jgi:hypothetical protein
MLQRDRNVELHTRGVVKGNMRSGFGKEVSYRMNTLQWWLDLVEEGGEQKN